MKDCKSCEPKYVPGRLRTPRKRPCPYYGDTFVPNVKPTRALCLEKPSVITLRTLVIPANLGDDQGEYAPKPGAHYNLIVVYEANGAVYIYDSNGAPTMVLDPGYRELEDIVKELGIQMAELYDPTKIAETVDTYADLESVNPATVPFGEMVLVKADETHDGKPALYYWNQASKAFIYAYQPSPYYVKEVIDEKVQELHDAIEAEEAERTAKDEELDAHITDVENDLAAETTAREEADKAINQRIDDVVNSPDVRYIVDTYADLEKIDKSGIGDQDYARVLQDETHDNASTYYQFSTASQSWKYVGQTGPYYTKGQIDEMIGDIESVLQTLNDGEGV